MDLTDKKTLQFLCKEYGLKPLDSLSQNFLVSQDVLQGIIQASHIKKDDTILEVGPGFGTLTIELAERAEQVYAVEKDKRMTDALRNSILYHKNVKVVHADILHIPFADLDIHSPYKVIANLPYNISSRFLELFLAGEHKPFFMALMLQKEVAERVCVKAGGMSILSVAVQLFSKPSLVQVVTRDCFWPVPNVDSAIVTFDQIKSQDEICKKIAPLSQKDFFKTVKFGFSSRRKQLHNNLSSGFRISDQSAKVSIEKVGLDPKVRAQELSIEEWIKLGKILLS